MTTDGQRRTNEPTYETFGGGVDDRLAGDPKTKEARARGALRAVKSGLIGAVRTFLGL